MPNELILDFLDTFHLPRGEMMIRFLTWQMTGEVPPTQTATSQCLALVSPAPSLMFPIDRSLTVNWRQIEDRLRWAFRLIPFGQSGLLGNWLKQTSRTDYERISFILAELENMKESDGIDLDVNIHQMLADIDVFQQYKALNQVNMFLIRNSKISMAICI